MSVTDLAVIRAQGVAEADDCTKVIYDAKPKVST